MWPSNGSGQKAVPQVPRDTPFRRVMPRVRGRLEADRRLRSRPACDRPCDARLRGPRCARGLHRRADSHQSPDPAHPMAGALHRRLVRRGPAAFRHAPQHRRWGSLLTRGAAVVGPHRTLTPGSSSRRQVPSGRHGRWICPQSRRQARWRPSSSSAGPREPPAGLRAPVACHLATIPQKPRAPLAGRGRAKGIALDRSVAARRGQVDRPRHMSNGQRRAARDTVRRAGSLPGRGGHPLDAVRVMVPVNLRPLDQPPTADLGNVFGEFIVSLPTGEMPTTSVEPYHAIVGGTQRLPGGSGRLP